MRRNVIMEKLIVTLLVLSPCGAMSHGPRRDSEEHERHFAPYVPSVLRNVDIDLEDRAGKSGMTEATRTTSFHDGPIFFPTSSDHHLPMQMQEEEEEDNEIPLNLLKELSNEEDLEKVFEKYVSNAKIEHVGSSKVIVPGGSSFVTGSSSPASPTPIVAIHYEPEIHIGGSRRNLAKMRLPTSSELPDTADDFDLSQGSSVEHSLPTGVMTPFGMGIRGRKIDTDFRNRVVGSHSNTIAEKVTPSAGCTPETKTVDVPLPAGNKLRTAVPKCIRIKQCGGCCGSSALTCEPVEERTKDIYVAMLEFNVTAGKFDYKKTETIQMAEHTKCECNCKVKETHCNAAIHRYDAVKCKCSCLNREEQQRCHKAHNKIWDSKTCTCNCRNIKECNSGLELNVNTCECLPTASTGRKRSQEKAKSSG